MWIEVIRTHEALAAVWLPWERLRAGGAWPGVFATPAGFQWLLRSGREPMQPWVLAWWQGRRLAGLLPLLASAHSENAPGQLHLPPLVLAPLGSQPTVFLLEVFQGWPRLGGQARGICGCWPWMAKRPVGRWAVVARWRNWAFRPQRPSWIVLRREATDRDASSFSEKSPCVELATTLADSFQEPWAEASWNGWSPGLTGDPVAWWQLAQLLQRHQRLLLVRLRFGDRTAWLLGAREPCGVVLLAWAGWEPPQQFLPKVLRGVSRSAPRAPSTWVVPAWWTANGEAGAEEVLYHWRVSPPGALWRSWLDRLRGRNKKCRPVFEPAQ